MCCSNMPPTGCTICHSGELPRPPGDDRLCRRRWQALTSRVGFFIEDIGDVAQAQRHARGEVGDRVPSAGSARGAAARSAMFEYMIGNLDWAMQAGPAGRRLLPQQPPDRAGAGAPGCSRCPTTSIFPAWSTRLMRPRPTEFNVDSVRQPRYRGYCRHNARGAGGGGRIPRAAPALLGRTRRDPGPRTSAARAGAQLIWRGFFADIATDAVVAPSAQDLRRQRQGRGGGGGAAAATARRIAIFGSRSVM